jgi:thiol-disulfide isomerase/thioredoxin
MKKYLIFITLIALSVSGCRSSKTAVTETADPALPPPVTEEAQDHVWDFRDATTWILGDFSPARFLDPPHSAWYAEGFEGYVPDPVIMEELKQTDISDYSITIVLGTWCPDSRREVPRFMKIAHLWGFPEDRIRFLGTDINKIAPLADYPALGIERVPTFIFYKNNSEAGRIIEVPVTSLEQDTRDILKRK